MRTAKTLVAVFSVALTACGGSGPVEETPAADPIEYKPLSVYTVNYPLAYFAERIGGDLVEVHFPAPKDEDPAFWSPDADIIAAYQGADLILLNGAGYAKWIDLASLPSSKIVDTSERFVDQLIPLKGTTTHSHGPEGEHEHGGYAFTTWLDPLLAVQHAQATAAAVIEQRPENEAAIQERLAALEADLKTLDAGLTAATGVLSDTPLVFSHPVYQYLIKRYDLNGVEIHWEPDQIPDRHAWDHLAKLLKTHPAKWMLWEGEPLAATVTRLEGTGINSDVFDPCGNRPDSGDYLTVMEQNTAVLKSIAR